MLDASLPSIFSGLLIRCTSPSRLFFARIRRLQRLAKTRVECSVLDTFDLEARDDLRRARKLKSCGDRGQALACTLQGKVSVGQRRDFRATVE